jgi:hypothetical protein
MSRLSEFRELKEIMDGVFESMGGAIFALVLQEIIRVAMRLRDKRRRVQKHFQLVDAASRNRPKRNSAFSGEARD